MGNIFGLIEYDQGVKNFHISLKAKDEQKVELNEILLLFYGEIYNKKYLQTKLNNSLTNDALLMAKAFKKYKTKAFQIIEGVYSCLIYDKQKEIIYALRDRVGIKPLYYHVGNNLIILSDKLKSFYKIDSFKKEIDQNSLALYLHFGYILQPYTIYKNSYKLKSGHYLEIDLKGKNLKQKKYWDITDFYNRKKLFISEVDAIYQAEKLLKQSIIKRLNTHSKYGSFLSGGYDSASVAYFLQQNRIEKIKTFTIGFEDHTIDEAPYAKKVANFIRSDHVEHYFRLKDAQNIIPKLAQIYDEPFADAGAVPSSLLAKLAKEHGIEILFGGDGGDEVFATADNLENFSKFIKIPKSLKKSIYHLMNLSKLEQISFIKNSYLIDRKYTKIKDMLSVNTISSMVKIKSSLFSTDEIKKLLKSDFDSYKTAFDEDTFGEYSECVDKIIGTYFKTFMSDGELIKSTQALSFYDIVLKKPYLDLELLDFLSQIPASLRVKNGDKKYILKQIIHKYIPKELLDRPKRGFSIPLISWLEGGLREFLCDILNEDSIKKDGIFNHVEIKNLKYQFFHTKKQSKRKYEFARKLWFILLFQLWYNHHIKTT